MSLGSVKSSSCGILYMLHVHVFDNLCNVCRSLSERASKAKKQALAQSTSTIIPCRTGEADVISGVLSNVLRSVLF